MVIAAAGVIGLARISKVEAAVSPNNASSSAWRLNKNSHTNAKLLERFKDKKSDNKITKHARRVNRAAHKVAVESALNSGDYNAWVKAVGTSSPMLKKINSGNFAKYVQAYQLRMQANTIMTELGFDKGKGHVDVD